MKIVQWMLAAILMTSGLGMLSSCHQIIEEQMQDVVCQWVSDYAEEGVDPETGLAFNRVVEVYEFSEKNAGYYECYLLNGDELVNAEYVRGENGDFHYDVDGAIDLRSTMKQRKLDICLDVWIFLLDRSGMWTMRYDDGLLDDGDHIFTPSTEAQREQILKWYESRHNAGLAEMIIGKWIISDKDGLPMPTNRTNVFTFVSATKAYMSASLNARPELNPEWMDNIEANVTINGNLMTLTLHADEHNTSVHEFIVTDINATEFTANHKVTVTVDGNVMFVDEDVIRLTKVTADYREAVLGLWECTGLTGIETYNDANARLEFLADGTYRYYRKDDGGQWQTVTTREFQDYFVDGTLLATRWKNEGETELREWWEIASINGDDMVWTALRQNADGSTSQQKMTWKKIDLNVSEKILGKWINTERNGEPMLTNKETVFTFISTTKALVSASRSSRSVINPEWMDRVEADVNISGNKVTVTFHPDEHTTSVHECNITDINGSEFTANEKVTVKFDGNVIISEERLARFEKVTADYREAVLGLWECTGLTGIETYNDANARLEFLEDGTYRYYRKNGEGQWEAVTTREFQNYFVDGTLLATRWKNQGEEELREWWEIESLIDNDMVWTALRQNADGTTFQQKMTWKKIELNLAENIIGKWMEAEIDGQPALTNSKSVITFVSSNKAIGSESLVNFTPTLPRWGSFLEFEVQKDGNRLTLTGHPQDTVTIVKEYNVTAIDDAQMSANYKHTSFRNGEVRFVLEQYVRYEKVTADYREAVLGLWECTELTGIETYNDANARLEFFADGTYKYWRKNTAGEWEAVTTREFQDYFVDGTLLATRWKNEGEDELREWWEIASIADGQMVWTALRQNADGTTVQQGMKWVKR